MYTKRDVDEAFKDQSLSACRDLPEDVLARAAAEYQRATRNVRPPVGHTGLRREVKRQAEAVAAAVGAAHAAVFLKAVYVRAKAPAVQLLALDEWSHERGVLPAEGAKED